MSLESDILSVNDLPIEAVDVPEWGKTLYVRAIDSMERDAFDESSLTKKGKTMTATLRNIRARLVALATCKGPADPSPVFSPASVDSLGKKSAKALDRLYSVAARLAGIREEDVDELAKNSVRVPNDVSGSN